jgi:hypothetical protein
VLNVLDLEFVAGVFQVSTLGDGVIRQRTQGLQKQQAQDRSHQKLSQVLQSIIGI